MIKDFIENLPPNHKLWFYGFSKNLSESQLAEVNETLQIFINSWQSHGEKVKASYQILEGKIIVIMVDQDYLEASGCSIDSSVAVLRAINETYDLDMFNRLKLAVRINEGWEYLHSNDVSEMIGQGLITGETICLNESVSNSNQKNHLLIPFKDSWMAKRVINA